MRKTLGFLACLLMLITAGNVLAAGYTCPTYKKYTSCKSGYYISNCPTSSSSWTGQTISSSSLKTGNSCKACPTGYTCSGGLVCPKAKTVTVTYNLNGGSGTRPASKVCTYGSACSLQSGATTSFYRAGYVFKGWSKSKTATTGSTSMTFTANTTVYAIWTACAGGTYKPGSGTMASAACSTCTGATYSEGGAATCEPCPEGYDGDTEPGKYTDKQCKMSVPAGYYVEHTSDKEPTACATGMYKGAHMVGWGGNSKCNTCPAGYDDGPGPGAGAQTDCKINVSAGKYIATANSSTQTTCTAGYKCPGGLVNYGSTGTRTQCTGATYSGSGASTCTSCPGSYTANTTAGKTSASQCQISVSAGKYIATANSSTQSTCKAGTYKASHKVNYGSISSCSACTGRTKYSAAGAGSCSTVSSGYYTTGCNTSGNNCTGQTQCTGATYCTSGVQNSCPSGYTANTTAGKTAASQCQINCVAGARVAERGATCTSEPGNWVSQATTTNYGKVSLVYYCPAGFFAPGNTAAGHDNPTDCVISVSGGHYIPSNTMTARYIRMQTISYPLYVTEIQAFASVWGTGTNLLLGKGGIAGSNLTNATNNNWSPTVYASGTDLIWDIGSIQTIGSIKFALTGYVSTNAPEVVMFVSNDGQEWTLIMEPTTITPQVPDSLLTGELLFVAPSEELQCSAGTFAATRSKPLLNAADTCTQCTGATYSGAGAASCTSCPAQTSGWTRATGTGWTSYTSCYQTKAATSVSSYCNSGTLKQTATSSTTWGATTISSALSAKAGAYVNGQTCSQCTSGYYCTGGTTARKACSTLASGFYPNSAAGSDAATDCYTNNLSGKYVASAKATSATNCAAGTYKGEHKVNYGSTSSCSACTGATYSGAGASACTNCPSGYTANTTAGKTEANQCQISVEKDYYIASAGASSATECPMGHVNDAELVYYGDTSSCEPVKVNCEPGTFMWWWVNDGRTNCEPCHAKYYCPGGINIYGSGGTNSANSAGVVPIRSCPSGYTASTSLGKKTISECQISVSGGKYIASANSTTQSTCVAGKYKEAHKVNYGSTSSCNSCSSLASGFYPNSAAGSDAATDCYTNNLSGQYVASAKATSATPCANWTYKGSHTVKYGSTSSCTSCPTLTSGWTKATGTGWTSYTSCYQTKSATAVSSYCSSGTLKQTATSSTTWGATTISSALSAKAGAYVNGQTCSQCTSGYYCTGGTTARKACVIGSYSAAGATSCIACANGKTTSAAGSASCNATCSNANDSEGEAAVKGWVDATWNTNNTVSNLCKAASCLGGENGHYLDNGNCPRCDSFANGLYPRSSNRGTTKGQEACFLYTADIPGKYIASQKATSATLCQKGTYSAGSTSRVVHYGETSSCDGCPDNTYADEQGLTACKSCLENYTTYGAKTSPSACRILCQGGSYLASANATQCSNVGSGYWAPQAYVTQGNVGTRNRCATGLTTIGFGSGADEEDDCGRILHIGDGKLYLRSTKKTDLALNVNIGGTTYYGNMSTEDKFMSDGIEKGLKLNVNGTIYSVYDDSADAFFGGGETGISISPNLAATTIVPASYNNASGLSWSATLSDGTTVSGVGACDATTAENGDISADGFSPSGTGSGCWCKINSPAQGARYVYGTTNSSCSTKCGYFCANNMKGTSAKNITYRTNLYTTAGISVQ